MILDTRSQRSKDKLRILQINLAKSYPAHLEMLNSGLEKHYDVILLQELHVNYYRNSATARGFRQVYPPDSVRKTKTIRSGIWVNAAISTNTWDPINVGDCPDLTAISIKGDFGKLAIFNLYNDCNHDETTDALRAHLDANVNEYTGEGKHMLWAGDFNRHHPMWDHDDDARLFTTEATEKAEVILDMLAEWDMDMALPKGIRTLRHNRSKNESRPDNVFITRESANMIISCNVLEERGVKTDHYYIETILRADKTTVRREPILNYREADWEEYVKTLKKKLEGQDPNEPILDEPSFIERVDALTRAIQETTAERIEKLRPSPHSRRWWVHELREMRQDKLVLSREAAKFRADPHHPSHQALRDHVNKYAEAMVDLKHSHFVNWLGEVSIEDLPTVTRYLKNPGDPGNPRIPTLTTTVNGREEKADSNERKAAALATGFFPQQPPPQQDAQQQEYEQPFKAALPITADRVKTAIERVAPYKAPGIDGIPNIVLKKCADVLSPHLASIFTAVFKLGVYHQAWKDSITCVLRKPGKPSYEVPKAYRPIALLSTIGKILSAIVAEDITRILEAESQLPDTHFGGRPNRTTTDALQYLVERIKRAWKNGRVASVLFLDVEGAFPNAVTEKVIHNLKKRRIPTPYVDMIANMLDNRRTKLKFDDYTSDFIPINNGIGQGCPLSMVIYIIYNADLFEIPRNFDEEAIGYVDDAILVAEGDDFKETTSMLKDMMTRPGGANEWSRTHNSRFEMSKVAVMHFSRKLDPKKKGKKLRETAPKLELQGTRIKVAQEYKYLGVLVDPELRWTAQGNRVIEKAKNWVNMFKRMATSGDGINSHVMRHLYRSVGIPQITYAADVWYTPPKVKPGGKRACGSQQVLKRLQSVQRKAALAITGCLQSTAGDVLNVQAAITPIEFLLEATHRRAYIRLCALPNKHIMTTRVEAAFALKDTKPHHLTPIEEMARRYQIDPRRTEKIGPSPRPPNHKPTFATKTEKDRELSIKHEQNDDAPIKVYCDRSGMDGNIGAAASLYRGTDRAPMRTLHYHLGTKEEHSTYEAEWIGAILALWLVMTLALDVVGQAHISIYIDNQSVISSLRKNKPAPGQRLREAFIDMTDELRGRGQDGPKFTLKWISAHSAVERNEKIDEEAKAAAHGKTSDHRQLPNILRIAPRLSKSALLQGMKDDSTANWKAKWAKSPRYRAWSEVDDEMPSKAFRTIAASLPRHHASLVMQIRTKHFPLNDYLYKRKLTETDLC